MILTLLPRTAWNKCKLFENKADHSAYYGNRGALCQTGSGS